MKNSSAVAVVGETLSEKCRASLSSLGFSVIILPAYQKLGDAVSSHADMLICPINNRIFTFSEYAEKNYNLMDALSAKGCGICRVSEEPKEKYPNDVLLNCLTVGDRIFSKTDFTSCELKKYAREQGYTFINVNQGYARCTACPVSDNAIITADPSIAKAATVCGLHLLTVSQGHVKLAGYEYGFIGGACGVFEERIFFAGDLMSHPDGEKIAEFCRLHGKQVISLSDELLTDVGSIFFF